MTTGNDFLQRITADRRRRIEAAKLERPGHVLRASLAGGKAYGRLERALRRGSARDPLRLLCEVKRASPSRGVLKDDVDPVAMAKLYEAGGATAISLVTEPDHFRGDPSWVNAVRPATTLPILVKDFVVDSWQLLDAAVRGADGVLLLAALLSEVQLQRLIGEAKLLGLDPLVEVHEEIERIAALRAGATLVGINNRSLRTFDVDLETSFRLLPEMPPHATVVAESGLSRPEHLARLRATRCDAVLMGEVFMTAADPAKTLSELKAAAG